MLIRRLPRNTAALQKHCLPVRYAHWNAGAPNDDPKEKADSTDAAADAEKDSTDVTPEDARRNASAAADFMQNSLLGGTQPPVQQKYTPVHSSDTHQGVRHGKPMDADPQKPRPLKELVNITPLPVEKYLPRLMTTSKKHIPRLDDFPYPIHPNTLSQLRAQISTRLHPILHTNHTSHLPSFKEGIILMTCPMKGSEIYLKQLAAAVAAENGAVFLPITNDDLFNRLSGDAVIRKPPLKLAENGGNAQGGGVKSVGRRRWGSGQGTTAMVFQVMPVMGGGTGISAQQQEEDGEGEDIPSVPYPWFKRYLNSKGAPMALVQPRTRSPDTSSDVQQLLDKTFHSFFTLLSEEMKRNKGKPVVIYYEDLLSLVTSEGDKPAEVLGLLKKHLDKYPDVLIVAPHTSTFHKTPMGGQRNGGLGNIIKLGSNEEDDGPPDEEPGGPGGGGGALSQLLGGSRRRPKGLLYDTPLDTYIGVASVNVFPPPGAELEKLKKLFERDLRKVHWEANKKELSLAAEAAGIELPFTDDLIQESITSSTTPQALALDHLASQLLTPSEVETILFYSLDAVRQRIKPKAKNGALRLTPEEFISTCQLFSSERNTVEDMKNGTTYAGIFKKPSDRMKLSQREEQLLKQCLVKPDPSVASFNRVGGLGRTKRTIEELIRLPLQKPELFESGILSQSTTGILLFGPPGTGKTLLARAVAAESGANFLNVQMSDIQSMWVGENEKNVKSLFTLARKLKPCVIFIDEIDALLRARQRHQAHHVTNTINEFMQEWDGLQSDSKGVIVVGATNRPFDLDEAVLRRLPRRILVDMPDYESRVEILKIKLRDDVVGESGTLEERRKVVEEVARMTQGWSGSDLRNFCIAAAYASLRPHISSNTDLTTRPPITLAHFKSVLESGDVRPSLSDRAELTKQLKDWDKIYGTGSGGVGRGSEWGFELFTRDEVRV